MNIVDISLLILLGAFILTGFWFGIIHMIGAVAGTVLGALLAGRYYELLASWGVQYVGGNMNVARVLAFIAIFVLVNRLIGLVVYLLDKAMRFLSIIPFLKTFDRLLGAAFGLVEGTLVLGLAVYVAARFPWSASFAVLLQASQVAAILDTVGGVLVPLLPAALRQLQSLLAYSL